MSNRSPVLAYELDGVGFRYGGAVPVEALRPTSITVEQGEALAIVGPSGSGKTTLLQILGLLSTPTAGVLTLCGVPTNGLDASELAGLRASMIGFVFQAFHLMPRRTVWDNVLLGAIYQSAIARPARNELVAAAIDQVGLSHRASHRPVQLSGGESQRAAVARALVGSPQIVLADEPTGNLDSENSAAIVDLLMSINNTGVTVIVISHDLSVASRFPRVLRMADGCLEDQATSVRL
jgi:putative ABC transport system ATP-binding protein